MTPKLTFFHHSDDYSAWATLCLSFLVLVVATYVSLLESIRIRAVALAEEMSGELEEQRSKAQYGAKMSALGEMAGGVAHEINNPLSVIIAFSSQLRRGLPSGKISVEAAVEKIEKIEHTAERITKIVKGLRSFSRNADEDPMTDQNLSIIIAETVELCGERLKHRDIELRVSVIDDLKVHCRPVQISQVILNLLNNAHDAVMDLNERWVSIDVHEYNGKARIEITDSGKGIPPAVLEKMMQPFFTTKEVGKGTGLGLSIARGIMDAHHGGLQYDASCANTRFVIELPALSSAIKGEAA